MEIVENCGEVVIRGKLEDVSQTSPCIGINNFKSIEVLHPALRGTIREPAGRFCSRNAE